MQLEKQKRLVQELELANHVGDLDAVPNSWPWPELPGHCSRLGIEDLRVRVCECVCVFLSFCFFLLISQDNDIGNEGYGKGL